MDLSMDESQQHWRVSSRELLSVRRILILNNKIGGKDHFVERTLKDISSVTVSLC